MSLAVLVAVATVAVATMAVATVAVAPGEAGLARVALSVSPRDALVDTPVEIRATGLSPRMPVVLRATTKDAYGKTWTSRIRYQTNTRGTVDTQSSMRLFWSMQPVSGNGQLGMLPRHVSSVAISVLSKGRRVAATTVVRRTVSSNVTTSELTVAKDGLAGTFHTTSVTKSQPGVLLLGGSAGGHGGATGALLASRGYPSLSLGYFGEPGLPAHLQDVPLEYFEKALQWLGTQPGVDPKRITLIGISRGAEAALLIAANYPSLVHGVLACTTDSHVGDGLPPSGDGAAWTINGKPIIGGLLPVDRITAETLITGGGKDEISNSGPATKELVDTARAHGRTNVTGRVYPNAGHGAGCGIPNLPAPSEVRLSPATVLSLGGTSVTNSEAAVASWPALRRLVASP
jgi:dienelactone hydrolase